MCLLYRVNSDWSVSQMASVASDHVLYIMRGCPGSGKSTLATELKGRNGRVFSTDDFFVRSDGEYVFDPKKVAAYHKRNQERAREAVSSGVSPVVIDNTNTTYWEMRPYVETGLRHGYRVEFVEPSTPWRYDTSELSRRNSHGVNEETIKRMLKRFQKNPTVAKVLGKGGKKRSKENREATANEAPEFDDMPNKLIYSEIDANIATVEECNYSHLVLDPVSKLYGTDTQSGIKGQFGTGGGVGTPTGDILNIPFGDLFALFETFVSINEI